MLIRRATVKDAEAVHALLWAAKDEIPLRDHFNNDNYRAWVRDQCRDRNVWVMEHEGQLAGALIIWVDQIRYLVTDAAHRRARVAHALIEHAKKYARKKYRSGVWAQVRPDNQPVVRLLEKMNFVRDFDRAVQAGWVCYCSSKADRVIAAH